jgi:hypothetical protein
MRSTWTPQAPLFVKRRRPADGGTVSDAPELTADRLTPANPTIYLRVPNADLRQIRGLVPGRYVDLPEAMRALLRKGLTIELQGSVHG